MSRLIIKNDFKGEYRVNVIFYNENKKPYFFDAMTYHRVCSVKKIIEDFVYVYKFNMTDFDPMIEPSFIKIFSLPSGECRMYNREGKKLNLNPNDFKF